MEALPVNQIIVKYKSSANLASAAAAGNSTHMQRLSDAAGVPLLYLRSMSGEAHVLRLTQRMEISRVLEICARIAAMPDVEYAEPDYVMHATGNTPEGALVAPNGPQHTIK
jgi:serine protease